MLPNLPQKIEAYDAGVAEDEHHRYRSWEYCYRFFQEAGPHGLRERRDTAALQLGFYLASCGMYRGSSFLLQRAYTVHLGVIDVLTHPDLAVLWQRKPSGKTSDAALIAPLLGLVSALRDAYAPFGQATDTLITKVILGTVSVLPACDRFFIDGFKLSGLSYSAVNRRFIDRVFLLCFENRVELEASRSRIERSRGIHYPMTKLLDMYFCQVGYEASPEFRSSRLRRK